MNRTPDDDAEDSLVGRMLGEKYLLTRQLGRGGYGEVYAATNTATDGPVAIKILHPHLLRDSEARKRFLQEARAATKIQHENVVKVFDLALDPTLGALYIVQEFLAGETLKERLNRLPGRRMSPEVALTVMFPVMEALVVAHEAGIVHRDLKPENIFLVPRRNGDDIPKVIDFGIAKLGAGQTEGPETANGRIFGSPCYMSPEQARGEVRRIDAQTDVWAVGVVLYKMLTDRLPYEAETLYAIVGMIQTQSPVRLAQRAPTLPADLVAAIDQALARDRTVRYPTMQAFLDALQRTSVGARVTHPHSETVEDLSTTVPNVPAHVDAERKSETLGDGWSKETVPISPRRPWIALGAAVAFAFALGAVLLTVHRTQSAPPVRGAPLPRPPALDPAPRPTPPGTPEMPFVPPPAPVAPPARPSAPETPSQPVAVVRSAPAPGASPRGHSNPSVGAAHRRTQGSVSRPGVPDGLQPASNEEWNQ